MVQLEVEIQGTWRPVIRYDTAHGFGHIDRYNLKGVQRKERLHLPYDLMLIRAERDIKQKWAIYRERFLKGEFP